MAHNFINIFMEDGTPEGTIELFNQTWNGKIFRINRKALSNYTDNSELKQPGIYFLLGKNKGNQTIYIGQANVRKNSKGVLTRVIAHDNPKEKWDEVIIVIDQMNNIQATQLNYLEWAFHQKAINAGKCQVVNKVVPALGAVNKQVTVPMDQFVDEVETFLRMIGYQMFKPKKVIASSNPNSMLKSNTKVYYIKQGVKEDSRYVDAVCEYDGKNFVLKAGSIVALTSTTSCPKSVLNQRNASSNLIDKKGIILKDVTFTSPSGIAQFATFSSANGNIVLKDINGNSFSGN